MTQSISKGYTFGSTELVTSSKLHDLVDDATLHISFTEPFQLGSIISSNLTIVHNLGVKYAIPTVWNADDEELDRSTITSTVLDANTLVLNMSSYPSLPSVANVRVLG